MPNDKTMTMVNLGDWAKPATTLIEKISDAAGILYEPRRIKQRALAEADAKLTSTKTDLEIRAMQRLIEEETKKQSNIEGVTLKALEQLEETASPDQLENDWISNFFEKVRIISDEDMQTLWSRVLAGEANKPGSFSKRTVNFLSDLDKIEAKKYLHFVGVFGM